IDLWRHFRALAAHGEGRSVRNAKRWPAFWGASSIAFALFVSFEESLIESIDIIASVCYGVVLGIFLVAFFLKRVGGTAIFWAARAAQLLIISIFFLRNYFPVLEFSYLWYNVIGCAACVLFSLILQLIVREGPRADP